MIEIHPSSRRGFAEHGWLHSWHSFSFADFYDPERMGFGALRVINEDIVEPGEGFGMHGHDNMEIVTIILEGELEHKDSQGHHGIIRAGDVQRMSAGTGIRHSEFNASKTHKVHLLQIWVHPEKIGLIPSYEQKSFPTAQQINNEWLTLVSGKETGEALRVHQKAVFSLGNFEAGKEISYSKTYPENGVYGFIIEGLAALDGHKLRQGDAAAVTGSKPAAFSFKQKTRLLVIEVPLLS